MKSSFVVFISDNKIHKNKINQEAEVSNISQIENENFMPFSSLNKVKFEYILFC